MQVMTINGARYSLAPLDDFGAGLRAQLAAAVSSGGAFVDFQTRSRAVISYLVTPHSSVALSDEDEPDFAMAGFPAVHPDDAAWFDEL